jgi:hypothetical protein
VQKDVSIIQGRYQQGSTDLNWSQSLHAWTKELDKQHHKLIALGCCTKAIITTGITVSSDDSNDGSDSSDTSSVSSDANDGSYSDDNNNADGSADGRKDEEKKRKKSCKGCGIYKSMLLKYIILLICSTCKPLKIESPLIKLDWLVLEAPTSSNFDQFWFVNTRPQSWSSNRE